MEIHTPCVVALTWKLKDSLGETLDELDEPVEFLVGGGDLLPSIDRALQGHEPGAELHLNLEPEDAFGDYDEHLVYLAPRSTLPEAVEEGMLVEASTLPKETVEGASPDALLTITELYPEHAVLDGNHPLAGQALRFSCVVNEVRAASEEEIAHKHVHGGHGHHH